MKCECCGDFTSSKYCKFCDKLYFKDEKLRSVYRGSPKKVLKLADLRKCEKCKIEFKPRNSKNKFCFDCKENSKTLAEKWVNKKERKNSTPSARISYSHLRENDDEWLNRFKAYRG